MATQISSLIDNSVGSTPLCRSLERAKARRGPSVGQWLEFPGYLLARTIASLGPDWVLIDCEHGNIDDHNMYLQIGAIASSGVSPIIRIPTGEPWLIKRALDAGAHAIMVPMCDTKEQAEAIVRASKYKSRQWPKGCRGVGAVFAPAALNQTTDRYLRTANKNVMICVQIESRTAVENIEEIAQVEGIDILFIGPYDLCSSMGYPVSEYASNPEVQQAVTHVLQTALRAGKYVGHFAASAETAAQLYKRGFHFINCGADIIAITSWISTEMSRLKVLVQEEED